MIVLVACETSGVVREAFRRRGHDAFSCDLLPADDGSAYHFQCDALELIPSHAWDLVIAHPPCTDLAVSGARWFKQKQATGQQQRSIQQFLDFVHVCEQHAQQWAVENPISIMSTHYRKPDQIIQPWQFGHGETKATCLWTSPGLPPLRPTNIVEGREPAVWKMGPSPDRWKKRSRTYDGIAAAMAEQWGG
jgi:hypothetical protein